MDSYEIVALDLYGETIKYERFDLLYENTDCYYETVCRSVQALIHSLTLDSNKILGVGIVLQGLISNDGTQVTYGKILGCTGLRLLVICLIGASFSTTLKQPRWMNFGSHLASPMQSTFIFAAT